MTRHTRKLNPVTSLPRNILVAPVPEFNSISLEGMMALVARPPLDCPIRRYAVAPGRELALSSS